MDADSSDEEEDYMDDLAVPLPREDLHKLPPEDTDSFCRWVDKTQDAGLPQRMLEEYEKRRANQQPSKEASKVHTHTHTVIRTRAAAR
jgi:hypothetical protein